MSFTLGMDIGIVMVKGVILGVLACVTILPSMILCCDKIIEKRKHKPFLPDIGKISDKVTKRYLIYVAMFVVLLFPAIYGNNHTGVYYNLDETLVGSRQPYVNTAYRTSDNQVVIVEGQADAITLGQKVMLILGREPHPLYRALELNGYAWQTERKDDGSVEILIWHKAVG